MGFYNMLLEPKQLDDAPVSRGGAPFVLSKFPATVGREILMQYPASALPKLGDYATNEAIMLKIMRHVGVMIEGRDEPLLLATRELVDNHVKTTEDLMRLEWAMMNYNFDFFGNGKLSGILDLVTKQVVNLMQKTLTDLLPVSQANKEGAARP
jgi:hypothetical protein